MKIILSSRLRIVFLFPIVVVAFCARSSYAQSPTTLQLRSARVVYENNELPKPGDANRLGYSRADNAEVTRALDRAEAARTSSPPRYDDAENAYRFAIFADPYDTRAYFGLGFIFAAQKRYAEAGQAYRRAVDAQPDSPAAHFNLGLMYVRLNNNVEALKQVKILERMKSELAVKLARHLGK
jgi:tetratricopeptide (TPR) repeat protein